MQAAALHKMDPSSHNAGSFSGGSYRAHNEPARSYGAQFHTSQDKSKGYEGPPDSTTDNASPYTGWQNMNNAANANNWPNDGSSGKPVIGRGVRDANKDEGMNVDDTSAFAGLIGATGGTDNDDNSINFQNNSNRQGQMPRLGLLGGGESSMVSPPANWTGNQGPSNAGVAWGNRQNGPNDMGGNSTAGTPTKPPPQASWAQAAGKGLPPGPPTSDAPTAAPVEAPPTPKEQEAKDFRLKVAFSEGWGQNSVNQDTPWDISEGDVSGTEKEGQPSAVWRAPVNNGTEIWESSLRRGGSAGQAPPAPPGPTTQPPPWGHTPATNIGGHWGDDDPSWGQRPPPEAGWADQSNAGGNTWNSGQNDRQWNNQGSWGGGGGENAPGGQDNSHWSGRNRNWSPLATPKKEPVAPAGWEPNSPPPIQRMPPSGNYDDGTAGWGNPQRQGKPMQKNYSSEYSALDQKNSCVSHWKDMPPAKPIMNSGMRGMPPKGEPNWNKPPPPRYQELQSPTLGGNWGEEPPKPYGWNNENNSMGGWNKPKQSANWADGQVDTSSWLGPAKQVIGGKPLCKDIVHASKQFRILSELGYRKEDVENALRNNNMNFEEAAAELQNIGSMEVDNNLFGGRKVRPYEEPHDPPIDTFNPSPFQQPNFNNFPPTHKSSNKGGSNNNANNLSPALIQKLLQQQQQQQQQQQSLQLLNLNNLQQFGNQKLGTGNNVQIRHLVQQIQMAVQAGHLNAQILNQPLSGTTLQVLYQLLQQIKALAFLHQQLQLVCASNSKPSAQLQLQVAQAKSRIAQLQAQICQQQTHFLKQQQHLPPQQPPQPAGNLQLQQGGNGEGGGGQLQNDFRDLSLKDFQQNQSRLTQWKAPSFNEPPPKDHEAPQGPSGDFSRAPGPSKGSSGHNLLEQSNNTWSQNTQGEPVWPDATSPVDATNGTNPGGDNKDSGYNFTDLVPEFEPGKPWKGSQLKNVDDDPHITPGSIARSPLALGSLKDSNLFWQPPTQKNDTWGGYSTASSNKLGKSTGWNSDFGAASSDLWGSSKSRNAPPGWERQNNSTFLVLRNLTPQIDGSTLKTLCMQHGPLQTFHLFLSRGVALVRYSSCEEAAKAQGALNNCVLSNTTMLADIPSEHEVQQYLQVAGQNSGNSWPTTQPSTNTSNTTSTYYGGGGNGVSSSWNNGNSGGGNSSGQLWSNSSQLFSNSGLWSSSQSAKEHEQPANPINFLPNDLLGGEPM